MFSSKVGSIENKNLLFSIDKNIVNKKGMYKNQSKKDERYIIHFLSDNLKYIQEFKGIKMARIGIRAIVHKANEFLLFMKNSLTLQSQISDWFKENSNRFAIENKKSHNITHKYDLCNFSSHKNKNATQNHIDSTNIM